MVHRPQQHSRRLSSAQSPPPRGEEERAERLGFTLGLRQGSYLALVPGGADYSPRATLIPWGSCDALFLLAFVQATIHGHPTEEAQTLFFNGLVRGRRRAEAFFASSSANVYSTSSPDELLALAALLSYRQAFRWSQSLPSPLASEGEIYPEILGELEQKVSEEFLRYRSEDFVLDGVVGHLYDGLRLFALADAYLVVVPTRWLHGKTYNIFHETFALMYRYLESAPPDWDTPHQRKLLEAALADELVGSFGSSVLTKGVERVNRAIDLAQRLFFTELRCGLWPRRWPAQGLTASPPFDPSTPVGLILSRKKAHNDQGESYLRLNAVVLEGGSPRRRVSRRSAVEAHVAQRLEMTSAADGPLARWRLPLVPMLYELHDRGAENPRHGDHGQWLETLEAWERPGRGTGR